jgi:putative ABC transport system permease protein
MFKNGFKVSLRNIKNEKEYTAINILGLTLGITCTLYLLLYVLDELSYDRFHKNADRIYRVITHITEGENQLSRAVTQIPLAEELVEKYPEVQNATRFYTIGRELIQQGDKLFYEEEIYFADSTVFDMFDYPFLSGDPGTALDQPFSIVITESMAVKYFGETEALDKTLVYVDHNQNYKVTGVIKDVPHNTHFRFDALMSISSFPPFKESENWGRPFAVTYIQLPDKYEPARFEKNFEKVLAEHVNPIFEKKGVKISYELQRITDIHLRSKIQEETEAGGDISYIYIFCAIAAFILIIACINYMNLAIARSARRAKEVGIRKVVGSQRGQLVVQFLTESVVLAFISLVISLILVYLFLPTFNSLAEKQLTHLDLLDPFVLLAMAGILFFVGIGGGSYPAFYLSRFNPAAVLKGGPSGKGGNLFTRKILVVVQFTISTFMLICTLVVFDQLQFIMNKDLGFDKEQVLMIAIDDGNMRQSLTALHNRVINESSVENFATASAAPGDDIRLALVPVEDEEGKMTERTVSWFAADYNFVTALGMTIVEGRNFSRDILSDTAKAVLVNEAMVEKMGWKNPLGKRFQNREVVGVLQDYHQNSLYEEIQPLVILLNKNNYYTFIKIGGSDLHETVKKVENAWQEVFPNKPFEFQFLDQNFDAQYKAAERRGVIFTIFSAFSVIIACLGLLGLTAYTTEQRAKEIGIRKVVGAGTSNIVVLIGKDFILLVALSIVIAVPVAYYFMGRWLEDFAYKIRLDDEAITFILSAAITLSITMLTVGYHSAKAATSNPVKSLRAE